MNNKINIAIDGYSSCGKSTMAKQVAKELNYIYIDTGAMYRAVALHALQQGVVKDGEVDREALVKALDNAYISFRYNSDKQLSETYLNGQNVELEIRSLQVSSYVSQVSDVVEVRQKLVRLQQRMAESRGVVMDGRDIGTVVLPDAELKFFVTADRKVRAQRRYAELMAKGMSVTLEEVVNNLNMRDHLDSTRKSDPLRQAKDAVVLDNTNLTMEEQYAFVLNLVRKELEKKTAELTAAAE
ncbi:MAG: (d)CMP kinase [Flavobacteriales bacterium]